MYLISFNIASIIFQFVKRLCRESDSEIKHSEKYHWPLPIIFHLINGVNGAERR